MQKNPSSAAALMGLLNNRPRPRRNYLTAAVRLLFIHSLILTKSVRFPVITARSSYCPMTSPRSHIQKIMAEVLQAKKTSSLSEGSGHAENLKDNSVWVAQKKIFDLTPSHPGLSDSDDDEPADDDSYLSATPTRLRSSSHIYPDPKHRYDAYRFLQLKKDQAIPRLARPPKPTFDYQFYTSAAAERYYSFGAREFLNQLRLPIGAQKFRDVERLVHQAGLIYSVIDVQQYVPSVVREFYTNLGELVYDAGTSYVYVRGQMFEFSSTMINKLLGIVPVASPPYSDVFDNIDLDESVFLLTAGKNKRWEDLQFDSLTPTMAMLYKLCCHNWMPTTNWTSMLKDRVKFVALIALGRSFDFGAIVFHQICAIARRPGTMRNRIMFPSLVNQLLTYQRWIPRLRGDLISAQPCVLSLADTHGYGSVSDVEMSLAADLHQLSDLLKQIRTRVKGKSHSLGILSFVVLGFLYEHALKQGEITSSINKEKSGINKVTLADMRRRTQMVIMSFKLTC